MKTLYLECSMGASGDMLMAALLELIEDKDAFINKMESLGIPGVRFEVSDSVKCGIKGTHVKVTVWGEDEGEEHGHHHHGSGMKDILSLIDGLDLSPKVKDDARAVYGLIADAESKVHGKPVDQIHFHEVGAMDAVADICGVCLLMDMIGAERIVSSSVHAGSGFVRCAHGLLPVPAPATAILLEGIPFYGGKVEGELCTPTGAALLRHFVSEFGSAPVIKAQKIGYGMGTKDFERANCLRAFLGESEGEREEITRLECNLDDMTGEEIGFAMDRLFKEGARDVYTQSIGMKKSRPGVLLSVICLPEDADRMAELIMKHTTTLGIRREDMSRYVLERSVETKDTELGPVRIKYSSGMGITRSKAEYDDLAKIAEEKDLPISEVRKAVEKQRRS